ncbi:unnamed protein product, partial [Polarella glacialis]
TVPWKERPRRFVEPPLVTHVECTAYKQSIKKELHEAKVQTDNSIKRVGPEAMTAANRYLKLFQKEGATPVSKEHAWTIDRVNDDTGYDPKTPRDTFHARHTAAARKQCKVALETGWQLRSSQAYGWMPPIDMPSYGHGRTSYFQQSSQDKSHLQTGGPWTAR